MTPLAKLAATLKRVRKQRGWTQAKLATVAGLHPGHVAKLEQGRQSPTFATLEKLANALDVTVGHLTKGH